jgi:hypothetical protein
VKTFIFLEQFASEGSAFQAALNVKIVSGFIIGTRGATEAIHSYVSSANDQAGENRFNRPFGGAGGGERCQLFLACEAPVGSGSQDAHRLPESKGERYVVAFYQRRCLTARGQLLGRANKVNL